MDKKEMKLTEKEVLHIACLAQLILTSKEVKKLQSQLSETLSVISKLSAIDTKNTPPTSQVTKSDNVTREDVIDDKQVISVEEALKNASSTYNNLFKVKAIFNA